MNNIYLPFLLMIILFIIFYYYKSSKYSEHFTQNIPIYIINLDRSPERLNKIKPQCEGLNCIRISAIDGSQINKNDYNQILKKKNMTPNTMACFLSHIKCLNEFMKTQQDYIIVIEDDVKLDKNIIQKLYKIKRELTNIRDEVDLLFLGGTRVCGVKYSESLIKPIQTNPNCNAGTFGYLLSRRGAQIILDKFNEDGIYKMYDHQIRDYFPLMQVYTCNPPIILHDFDQKSVRVNQKYNNKYIKMATSIEVNNE